MVVGLPLLLSAVGRGERLPFRRADGFELTLSMAIAVGVRMFAVDARYIPTDSMEPTFAVGDHLLLDKVSRVFRPPARGDVVCVDNKRTWHRTPEILTLRDDAAADDALMTVRLKHFPPRPARP